MQSFIGFFSNIPLIKEDIKKLEAREFYIKYIIKTNNWYFAEYQHTEGNE